MAQKVVILGGGESGRGAALLASKQGFDVLLSDAGVLSDANQSWLSAQQIAFEHKGHTIEKIAHASLVIKSPGIAPDSEIVQRINELGIPICSELDFARRYTNARLVCITGTNGKSTTTKLIHHVLSNAGIRAGLAGNIGISFARAVAEAQSDFDWYVLEVSSFQLDDSEALHPHVAVITNITPDHLNRYHNRFENYVASKFRIVRHMGPDDYFIYHHEDAGTTQGIQQHTVRATRVPLSTDPSWQPAGSLYGQAIQDNLIVQINQNQFSMKIQELALQGRHNVLNSLAAAVTGKIMDIQDTMIRESLTNFQGLEHRLEFVSEVNHVRFINDSKATNVNSAWYALECTPGPIIWIAGGEDKGNDYSELLDLVKQKVKAIICLTTDSKKLHKAFGKVVPQIIDVTTAESAVRMAYELSREGDTVLLAPACASFDLFANYEERGRKFKEAVRKL